MIILSMLLLHLRLFITYELLNFEVVASAAMCAGHRLQLRGMLIVTVLLQHQAVLSRVFHELSFGATERQQPMHLSGWL